MASQRVDHHGRCPEHFRSECSLSRRACGRERSGHLRPLRMQHSVFRIYGYHAKRETDASLRRIRRLTLDRGPESTLDRERYTMSEPRMRIGEFSRKAGVSVDAVRFYERRGILSPAPRTNGGYRTFDEHDLERVRLTKQFQQLGLTVDEVVDALTFHGAYGEACASERWRLEQVEARIAAQLSELRHTRRLIRETLAACEAGHCHLTGGEGTGA